MCSISKTCNHKLRMYTPLSVPSKPWESVSMDFIGGLLQTRNGHDYLYVVVVRFLIYCKTTIDAQDAAHKFFEHVWVHFRLLKSTISDRHTIFLPIFWKTLWKKLDTTLSRSTSFHPQTDGQTKVVKTKLVHLLRGYNHGHPKTWDESLPYIQHSYNRAIHSSTNMAPYLGIYLNLH